MQLHCCVLSAEPGAQLKLLFQVLMWVKIKTQSVSQHLTVATSVEAARTAAVVHKAEEQCHFSLKPYIGRIIPTMFQGTVLLGKAQLGSAQPSQHCSGEPFFTEMLQNHAGLEPSSALGHLVCNTCGFSF